MHEAEAIRSSLDYWHQIFVQVLQFSSSDPVVRSGKNTSSEAGCIHTTTNRCLWSTSLNQPTKRTESIAPGRKSGVVLIDAGSQIYCQARLQQPANPEDDETLRYNKRLQALLCHGGSGELWDEFSGSRGGEIGHTRHRRRIQHADV
jgi:hypothetical protein